MKKIILIFVIKLVVVLILVRSNEAPKLLNFSIQTIDSTAASTSIDDSDKYQILIPAKNESISIESNSEKEFNSYKLNVEDQPYNIGLHTNKLLITSKITVSASRQLANTLNEKVVASND